MYNPEVQRIDRQIEDLQRLRNTIQSAPQPINNIINTPISSAPIFEAKFTTEDPSNILVQNKTAFIDLKNGKLTIKDVDGELKEYFIILPKDEKDLKIENLENKIKSMEVKLNEYSKSNSTIVSEQQSNVNGNGNATKSKVKNSFFKNNEYTN